MYRSFTCLLAVVAATSCQNAPAPNEPAAAAFDRGILGRWDVTVHAEATYPMWFDITEDGGRLSGRLQRRTGHALPLERVEAHGATLEMELEGTILRGELSEEDFEGTGTNKNGSFHWIAVRAPELPAPHSMEWGEPVELFNGKDLTGWMARDPSAVNQWKAIDGELVNEAAGTDLVTEAKFWNFQLHAEVNVPEGSNSGIYLRGRYEVQVLDDFAKPNELPMGSIYGQVMPSEEAALAAGEWQSFDITLLGRYVTVVLNGKTIIDQAEIPGTTGGALDSNESEPGPIFLQGDHGRILYRNLVLRPAT